MILGRYAAAVAIWLTISGPVWAASSGIAFCVETGKVGMAAGQLSEYDAEQAAINDCVERGGRPNCCVNQTLTTSSGCIAIARGNNNFGFGTGTTAAEAVGNAIIQCQLNTQQCVAMGHLCE